MAEPGRSAELSIDTAGAMAGVCVSRAGEVIVELTWNAQNNHSAELVPAIDEALRRAHAEREAVRVLFVNRGPGSYAGLRVGISTAMGIALGLGAELLAVGRLDLDAYQHAAYPGPVCAIHQAGRGDLARAVYRLDDGRWHELEQPALLPLDVFLDEAPTDALFCGELAGLEERLAQVPGALLAVGVASLRRPGTLAALGWQRYQEGARDNPVAIEPIYLREPSITQPKPRIPTR
jgi:tRNA threonylcarbamoyladenosine biosynthesis protein TsaB